MPSIKAGATDVTRYYILRDSTAHEPKTDITVTDIDLYYTTYRAAMAAKIDCTALDAANSAHADGKAFNCGRGVYRVDWPDAAFAGSPGEPVQLQVECTGVDVTPEEIWLSPPVDMAAISSDSAAADNLEAACDGGSYNVGGGAVVAASVTGAVGSVTGAVGSVTGSVGSVTGAVGSVAANGITATSIAADAINAAAVKADAVTKIQSGLSTLTAQQVWEYATRTVSTYGTLVADVATAVWGAAARTLTAFAFTPTPSNAADTTAIKAKTDNLPAAPAATGDIPSAAAIRAEIDSNSTQLTAILADTNELQTDLHDGGRLDLILDAILLDTGTTLADKITKIKAAVYDSITASGSVLTLSNAATQTVDEDGNRTTAEAP